MKIPLSNFNEIKNIAGHVNTSNSFNDLKPFIETSVPDLVKYIGQAMYDIAIEHYNSDDYNVEPQTEEAFLRLDVLVKTIQRILIFKAYERYSVLGDLETSDAGRKITVSETQKMPFEWALDRYDAALSLHANESLDSLLSFILREATQYSAWITATDYAINDIIVITGDYYKCITAHTSTDFFTDIDNWTALDKTTDIVFWQFTESPEYIALKEIFVPDTRTFQNIINIDNSHRYFFSLRTILNSIQNEEIYPRLADTDYQALLSAIRYNNLSTTQLTTLQLIQKSMAFLAHAEAIQQYHISVMPRAVYQVLQSEFGARNASKPVTNDQKDRFVSIFRRKGEAFLLKLEEHLRTLTFNQLPEAEKQVFVSEIIEEKAPDFTKKYCRL